MVDELSDLVSKPCLVAAAGVIHCCELAVALGCEVGGKTGGSRS